MYLSDFDFTLPAELIAKTPTAKRTQSRLLIADTPIIDTQFYKISNYLNAGDLLILNNTKVIPARLFAYKKSGGRLEIMIERLLSAKTILAMIKAARLPKVGDTIYFDENKRHCAYIKNKTDYLYTLVCANTVEVLLNYYGQTPLPPYIKRAARVIDKERYQTVYAKNPGAVAAPTAGLHFDNKLLKQLKKQGVSIAEITLHVGAGTFLPIRTNDILAHKMYNERVEVSKAVQKQIAEIKHRGGRIIAVGTTVVRALESYALNDMKNKSSACNWQTAIFIYPGFRFRLVDALITNFHLPKSTLLLLVSAFAGTQTIKTIYTHAIAQKYRFFSYGDAMFLQLMRTK